MDRREFLETSTRLAGAALLASPWLIRNAVWYHNPLAPFFNAQFPNQFVDAATEQRYREQLRHWGNLPSPWSIPWEVTVSGFALQGLVGPVLLIAPVALLALRYRVGRRLLFAAFILALPYSQNLGTRFLIPALPFVMMAMCMFIVENSIMSIAMWIHFHVKFFTIYITSVQLLSFLFVQVLLYQLQELPVQELLQEQPFQIPALFCRCSAML